MGRPWKTTQDDTKKLKNVYYTLALDKWEVQ